MVNKWLIAPFLLCGELITSQLAAECDCQTQACQPLDCEPQCCQYDQSEDQQEQEEPIKNGIRGIFITSDREDIIPGGRPDQTGVQVFDFRVPGGPEELTAILEEYLGRPMTKKTLIEIKQRIMQFYVDQGNSLIGIEIPAQKTRGGVVQFLVIQKTYGKSIFKGKAIYSQEKLERLLDIDPCDLNENDLRNNLAWINKNNFQAVNMRFVKSEDDPDVVDIVFTSKSRPQIRPYIKGDNTGSASTGWGRMAVGFNWGNAFWLGDILTLEYKTSNLLFKTFHNGTLTYLAILPWKHFFTVFGTYANIKPKNRRARINAYSWQVRPKYNIPFLPLYTSFQHSITFEYAWKFSNSNVFNLVQTTQVQNVNPRRITNIFVTEFIFNYTMFYRFKNHSLSFYGTLTGSPFTYLPHQSERNYGRLRFHSKPKFAYVNLVLGDVITFKNKCALSIFMRSQLAPWTLPSTELFSVGGYFSVRGYTQSKVSGDNGFVIQNEFRLPAWKTFPKKKGSIKFLAFMDYGISNNLHVQQSTRANARRIPHTQDLWGVGPGFRYNIGTHFQLRCDYGFKLLNLFGSTSARARQINKGIGELHIGALASY